MYHSFTGLDHRWCRDSSCESSRIVRRFAANRVESSTFPTHPGSTLFSQSSANRLPACRIDMKGDDSCRIDMRGTIRDESSTFLTHPGSAIFSQSSANCRGKLTTGLPPRWFNKHLDCISVNLRFIPWSCHVPQNLHST